MALLGGDTFGIHDDDAFYCKPGSADPLCPGAAAPGYRDHTTSAPHLGSQLEAAGLSWKGYYEDLPAPGSLAVIASPTAYDDGSRKTAVYASKHSGFVNFAQVQADPHRAQHIVGFGQWRADLASGRLPNFALIAPNQCNEGNSRGKMRAGERNAPTAQDRSDELARPRPSHSTADAVFEA